ncbi:cytochrome c biogenesis CcdA family protein [Halobacillus seohaensis]|uniref:Cytochrome c biogenesis CcdA family protein n=1 Tax=Halobacillus seohaensis TaxID=447421 RepID=A0ABW2ERP1_9BACI
MEFVYNQLMGIESITLMVYFAVFLGGILSAVSPCYIPILIFYNGFITAYSKGNGKKAILMTLFFVLGMAITSAILGGIAAFIGNSVLTLFTDYRLDKWIPAIIGITMGLSLIGILKFRFPSFLSNRINWNDKKPKSLTGAFSLGLLFGVVVTPCTIPIFITIMTLVAVQGSIFAGSSLLIFYAIGKGIILLVVAYSSDWVMKFSGKDGKVEKISGFIILAASLYILFFV